MQTNINGTPIYYEQYGEGEAILCIHGFPEDRRALAGCLEPIFDDISGYRRLYVDLPGLGKSPANPQIVNADDMLNTLFQFVEQVLRNEHFYLVGQSYGGYLALGLAQQLPKHIMGVYFLCPCVVTKRESRILPVRAVIKRDDVVLSHDDDPMDFEEFTQAATVITNATWQRYKTEVLPGLKCADEGFVERYQGDGYGFSFESELKAMHFVKPTTFLLGRQDDCVGYRDAFQLLECFPRASFQIVDGAGHNLQIEQPRIFRNSILDWLNALTNINGAIDIV